MATVTSLYVEKMLEKAIQAFSAELLPLNAFSTTYVGSEVGNLYTIEIPLTATSTATTYADNSNSFRIAGGTISSRTLTMSGTAIDGTTITDIQAGFINPNAGWIDLPQKAAAVGDLMLQDIATEIVTANYSSERVVTSAAFDISDVVALRKTLKSAGVNVRSNECSLVLNCDYFESLLNDGHLSMVNVAGTDSSVRSAIIPNLYGMQVFEWANLPAQSTEYLQGFACHKSALHVGMQPIAPQNLGGDIIGYSEAVAEGSDISLGLRLMYEDGNKYATFAVKYGKVKGNTNGLVRIVSQ